MSYYPYQRAVPLTVGGLGQVAAQPSVATSAPEPVAAPVTPLPVTSTPMVLPPTTPLVSLPAQPEPVAPITPAPVATPPTTPAAPITPYTPKTWQQSMLTMQDGKVYGKNKDGTTTEINPRDLISYTAPSNIYTNDENYQPGAQTTKAAWTFNSLGEIVPVTAKNPFADTNYGEGGTYANTPSDYNPYMRNGQWVKPQFEQKYGKQWTEYQNALNAGKGENYLKSQVDPFSEFTNKYRDVLYGAYGVDPTTGKGFNDDVQMFDPNTYAGQTLSMGGGKGGRGKTAAANATAVQSMLKQIYPDATQEQLDLAAWNALQNKKNETSDYFTGTSGQGWHYASNPNDVIRDIGAQMGGLPENIAARLAATDAQMRDRTRNVTKAAHKADDAASAFGGLGPLGGVLLGLGGNLLVPGLGTALGGGLGGALGAGAIIGGGTAALSGGDILKGALMGGAGAGIGNWASGLDKTGGVLSNSNLANIGGKAGLSVLGGGDLSNVATGALGQLAGQGVGAQIGDVTGNADLDKILRGTAGGLTTSAITGKKIDPSKLALSGLTKYASGRIGA
jgi:hypothetical protein